MQRRPSPQPYLEVRDPEAIRVLLDHRQRQALLPFVSAALSVSQAARQVGEAVNTTLKRVQRWQRLGLLACVGTAESARGRVKVYRTTASVFFVPPDMLERRDLDGLLAGLDQYFMAYLRRGFLDTVLHHLGSGGLRFSQHYPDSWTIQPARTATANWNYLEHDAPALLLESERYALDAHDAKAFQQELFGLLQKYRGRQGEGAYLVRLALAPAPDDTFHFH